MRAFFYFYLVYAIVDIETTGGFASGNGITEIAILLHNGKEVEGRFSSLVHPHQPIPRYISALTGITDEMVASAPGFDEIAAQVFNLLDGRIFVAHNVNFDYSFLKSHLEACGYSFQPKKLCTVRMARNIFPGFPSYSLGNLCRNLGIQVENRHRAMGDAMATATLFSRLLENDTEGRVLKMTKGKNPHQYLPPNLPLEDLENLPMGPGVYYFENQKKEVLYIGKALNLRKRVSSHFSNNDGTRRKQDLLRQVHHIRHTACASELMSLILESQEIRKYWPPFNRSQRKYHHRYGIYAYQDNRGLLQLAIDQKKNHLPALYTFNLMHEGQNYIRKITGTGQMTGSEPQSLSAEEVVEYNTRLNTAIEKFRQQLPSFVLVEKDFYDSGRFAVYLMAKGCFYGMGKMEEPLDTCNQLDFWKSKVDASPDNDYIRGLLYQFAERKNISRLVLEG